MNIAVYARDIWRNLNLSDFFGDGRQVLDQFKWYLEKSRSEKGSLELKEEYVSALMDSRVSSLLANYSNEDVYISNYNNYYDRRINVSENYGLLNMGHTYYVSQNEYDSMEINLSVDRTGAINFLYEDGTIVKVGDVGISSLFRCSRFHAHITEINDNVFVLIDDIFQFEGKFLQDMKFVDRLKIIDHIDFYGDYHYCTIYKKTYNCCSGRSLLEAIGPNREFIAADHIVSQYNGAFLFSDRFKHVIFCIDGKVFAIEWTDAKEISSAESEFAKAIKRIPKQRYPILKFIFNPRANRYKIFKTEDNTGGKICLWFHDEFLMIQRRIMEFSSVIELLHSIFAELVSQYGIINSQIVSLNNGFLEMITIMEAYYHNLKADIQVVTLREIAMYYCDKRYDGKFLLVSSGKAGHRVLHDLARIRIKNISHKSLTMERFSEPGKEEEAKPPDILEATYNDSILRLFD